MPGGIGFREVDLKVKVGFETTPRRSIEDRRQGFPGCDLPTSQYTDFIARSTGAHRRRDPVADHSLPTTSPA